MAISLRSTAFPKDAVLLSLSNTAPDKFTFNSGLQGKFIKGVATACTNPGNNGGSADHTHSSVGHTHAATAPHSHSVTFGANNNDLVNQAPFNQVGGAGPGHTHGGSTATFSSPIGCTGSGGCHTHCSATNCPPYATFAVYKKDIEQSIRNNSVPFNALTLWSGALACIPDGYGECRTHNDKYIKVIATSCTSTGATGGASTHNHGSQPGAHTHTFSGSHAHNNGTFTGGFNGCRQFGPGNTVNAWNNNPHYHNQGIYTTSSSPVSGTSGCGSVGHDHGSGNLNPSYITLLPIKKTSINMRSKGIPSGTVIGWTGTLASIPSCYLHADGTSCTPNTVGRLLRTPPACTIPNVTAGCNTPAHCSVDSHTHTGTAGGHTHTTPGVASGPVGGPYAGLMTANDCPTKNRVGGDHTHPMGVNTGSTTSPVNLTAASGHTHDSADISPEWNDLAFIQRV